MNKNNIKKIINIIICTAVFLITFPNLIYADEMTSQEINVNNNDNTNYVNNLNGNQASTIVYGTPEGSGRMDGTSWENAFPIDQENGLQNAWMATPQNGILYIGSGEYTVPQTLTIEEPKKLIGVDTGNGLPTFIGDYDRLTKKGSYFIDVKENASYWLIKDIRVKQYNRVINTAGKNVGYRIINVDCTEVRDAFYLHGGADPDHPDIASNDIIIKDCDIKNNHFRGIRLRGGNYNVKVINCHVDAGGYENYVDGDWPFGFQVSDSNQKDVYDHDITFIDCSSKNNIMIDDPSKYWNGDGFVAERRSYNLKYINCIAIGSSDGGFDDKSSNPTLISCIAIGNKRNFRFWSHGKATLINCYSGDSQSFGNYSSEGLWAGQDAKVAVYNSAFHNNKDQQINVEGGTVYLYNSIISSDDPEGTLYRIDESKEGSAVHIIDHYNFLESPEQKNNLFEVEFIDSDNNTDLNYLVPNKTIQARVSITDNNITEAMFIMILYDNESQVVDFDIKNIFEIQNQQYPQLTTPEDVSGHKLKTIIWYNLDYTAPFIEYISIVSEN